MREIIGTTWRKWVAPIGVLVVLAGCASPVRTPVEAQQAAVQWMVEHQGKDGSWGTIDAARPYQIYLDTQASHDAFGGATSALGVMV